MSYAVREATKKKEAAELQKALAAKPPSPEFVSEYVPPPVPNLQFAVEGRGRRPSPAETNRALESAAAASTVEELKAAIAADTRRGADGASAELTEASHLQEVGRIVAALARQGHGERVSAAVQRDARARDESIELIKAEMLASVHTEDYSGGSAGA